MLSISKSPPTGYLRGELAINRLGLVSVQLALVRGSVMVREVRVRVTRQHKQKKLVFSVPDRDTRLGRPAELARQGASVGYYFFHGGQILYCRPAMYPKQKQLPGTPPPTVSKVKGLPPVAESDSVPSRIYSKRKGHEFLIYYHSHSNANAHTNAKSILVKQPLIPLSPKYSLTFLYMFLFNA